MVCVRCLVVWSGVQLTVIVVRKQSTFFVPSACERRPPSPTLAIAAGALASLSTNAKGPNVTVRMVPAPVKSGVKRGADEMRDSEPEQVVRSAPVPSPGDVVAQVPSPVYAHGPTVHPCMTMPTPAQRQKISNSLRLLLDAQRHQAMCMHLSAGANSPLVALVSGLSGVPVSKSFCATLRSMIQTEVFRVEDDLQAHASLVQRRLPEGPVFFYTNSVATALNGRSLRPK